MKRFTIIYLLFLIVLITNCSDNKDTFSPEKVGLSSSRLALIDTMLNCYIYEGKLPGATILISRNNHVVYNKSFGYSNIENKVSMQNNSIYGIASMSKLVTSIAALTLYEKGYYRLNDKLSDYLPEFKNMKIFKNINGNISIEEAKNDILIKDLFRHTSGILYGSKEYDEAGANFSKVSSLEEFVKKIASVPLYCEPGTKFNYSYSTDILGFLVEKLSGKTLRDYFIENIFEPLKMEDTDFYLPKEKVNRLVSFYNYSHDTLQNIESNKNSIYTARSKVYSGGGGLVSTVKDYAVFLEMILNYGDYKGVRILSRKTIELLKSDFLAEIQDKGFLSNGRGHGLGVGLIPEAAKYGEMFSDGSIFWSGIRNTYYWVDFKENMFGIIMSQVSPFLYLPYAEKFRILTYQAIID